jgi:acetyl esterase/lipase
MPAALLVIGVVAVAAKWNAYRPTRNRWLMLPSFFFSLIVIELAGWWLAIEAGVTAVAPHEMRMLERAVMQRRLADEPAEFAKASPIDRVRPGAPAFFVLHGDIDSLAPVAEAREFVSRLRGVSAQRVVYAELAGAQHAFDIFPSHRAGRAAEAAERFLAGVHREYLDAGTADTVAAVPRS